MILSLVCVLQRYKDKDIVPLKLHYPTIYLPKTELENQSFIETYACLEKYL